MNLSDPIDWESKQSSRREQAKTREKKEPEGTGTIRKCEYNILSLPQRRVELRGLSFLTGAACKVVFFRFSAVFVMVSGSSGAEDEAGGVPMRA